MKFDANIKVITGRRSFLAGAPIFYNSKNLNCIGALSFYDSNRSIGEVLF